MRESAARVVSIFSASQWDEKLNTLAEEAERIFTARYPLAQYPRLDFRATVWDFARADVITSGVPKVHFTDQDNVPLPPAIVLALKAYIVHAMQNARHAFNLVAATLPLVRVLEERAGGAPVGWHLLDSVALLRLDDLLRADGYQAITRDSYLDRLRALVEWLEVEAEIVGGVNWPFAKGSSYTREMQTEAGRRRRAAKKMPTAAAMRGLGLIYRHHARTPQDRLLICLVGLMAITGFRIAEVISLPDQCVERRTVRGSERIGIRYWNHKTQGTDKAYAVRWLSPLGAELALELLSEIRTITAPARELARIMQSDRVPVPFGEAEYLTLAEVRRALGISANVFNKHRMKGKHIFAGEVRGPRRALLVPREAVERHLRAVQGPLAVKDVHGHLHSLAECLFCLPRRFFDSQGKSVGLLVEPVRANVVRLFLAGEGTSDRPRRTRRARGGKPTKYRPKRRQSVFERFDLIEERREHGVVVERVPCRIHPHQLRHWLNSLAYQSGMTLWEITTWMQRANAHHTRSYAHSAADTADRLRRDVEEGTVLGPVPRQYESLGSEERVRFLATLEEAARTSTGTCGMRLSARDCARYKAACWDCEHFSQDPRDTAAREALVQKIVNLEVAISVIERRRRDGLRIHPRQEALYRGWKDSAERTVVDGDVLLRRMTEEG